MICNQHHIDGISTRLAQVHVKNRCAWLNHSDRPKRFIDIVQRHPGAVRLWFSGHFHLVSGQRMGYLITHAMIIHAMNACAESQRAISSSKLQRKFSLSMQYSCPQSHNYGGWISVEGFCAFSVLNHRL